MPAIFGAISVPLRTWARFAAPARELVLSPGELPAPDRQADRRRHGGDLGLAVRRARTRLELGVPRPQVGRGRSRAAPGSRRGPGCRGQSRAPPRRRRSASRGAEGGGQAVAGPAQVLLDRALGAAERLGDLGHRHVVDVPQRRRLRLPLAAGRAPPPRTPRRPRSARPATAAGRPAARWPAARPSDAGTARRPGSRRYGAPTGPAVPARRPRASGGRPPASPPGRRPRRGAPGRGRERAPPAAGARRRRTPRSCRAGSAGRARCGGHVRPGHLAHTLYLARGPRQVDTDGGSCFATAGPDLQE